MAEGGGVEGEMDKLWNVNEVAAFLAMSRSWVYRESGSGRLPCVRLNGWALRFVPAQIRAYALRGGEFAGLVLPLRGKRGS